MSRIPARKWTENRKQDSAIMSHVKETKTCSYCSSQTKKQEHVIADFLTGKRGKVTDYCRYMFSFCSSCKCYKWKSEFESAEKKTCRYCTLKKRKQPHDLTQIKPNENNKKVIHEHHSDSSSSLSSPNAQEIKINYNPKIRNCVSKVKFFQDTKPQGEDVVLISEKPGDVRTLSDAIQLSNQLRLQENGQILIRKFKFKGKLDDDIGLIMALEHLAKNPYCTLKFKLMQEGSGIITTISENQANYMHSLIRQGRVKKDQILVKKRDIQGRDFEPISLLCPSWTPPDTNKSVAKIKKKIASTQPHACTSFSEFFLEDANFFCWKGSLKLFLQWTTQFRESMVPKYLPSLQIKITDLDDYKPKPKLNYWIGNDKAGSPYQLYYGNKRTKSQKAFLGEFQTFSPCLLRLIQHAFELITTYLTTIANGSSNIPDYNSIGQLFHMNKNNNNNMEQNVTGAISDGIQCE